MSYTYEYPRPSVTVDCVVFGFEPNARLKVLLIQRARPPHQGKWALPGGFVDIEEDLERAALRELAEETGVKDVFIEQLYTFGSPNRDPRGRVISVVYYALIPLARHPLMADSDAHDAAWFDINDLPALAFDHATIFATAIQRLRTKLRYQPIGFELLPEFFTLTQLQELYEVVLGVKNINKRNFRSRILKMSILQEVGQQSGVAHRPAKLYRFDPQRYQKLLKDKETDLLRRGLDFAI